MQRINSLFRRAECTRGLFDRHDEGLDVHFASIQGIEAARSELSSFTDAARAVRPQRPPASRPRRPRCREETIGEIQTCSWEPQWGWVWGICNGIAKVKISDQLVNSQLGVLVIRVKLRQPTSCRFFARKQKINSHYQSTGRLALFFSQIFQFKIDKV